MQSASIRLFRFFARGSPVLQRDFVKSGSKNVHSSLTLNQEWDDEPVDPTPRYDALNIQMKGYDFAVLEKFAKYVHNTADRIGLDVEDSWGTPAQNFKVSQFKPESTVLEKEYRLDLFERNVQIVDVPSTLLPVFVNIIEASIPPGVTTRVHPHIPEHTEIRFVPDLELKQLKSQLDDMGGPLFRKEHR